MKVVQFLIHRGAVLVFALTSMATGAASWADDYCPPSSSSPGAPCSPDLLRCAVAVEEREMRGVMQETFSKTGWIEHAPARSYVLALEALRACQKSKGLALEACWPKEELILTADFGGLGQVQQRVPLVEVAGHCQYGVPTPVPLSESQACNTEFQDKNTRLRGQELSARAAELFQREQLPVESDFDAYLAALEARKQCGIRRDPTFRVDCVYGLGWDLSGPLRPDLIQSMETPIKEVEGRCAYQADPNPNCPKISLRNEHFSFQQRQIPGKKPGCSTMVNYSITDSDGIPGARTLKMDDHGILYATWSRDLPGISASKSTIVSEYLHFPRSSSQPFRVEMVEEEPMGSGVYHDELVVHASGGRALRFDLKGRLVGYSGTDGFRQDFNFDPKSHGAFELGLPLSGILLDVGSKIGESPSLMSNGLSTFRDPFGNSCTVKNSELFRIVNDGDLEVYFKFETDEAVKVFLGTKCPVLNLETFF